VIQAAACRDFPFFIGGKNTQPNPGSASGFVDCCLFSVFDFIGQKQELIIEE
jgi:hypothetical protein